MIRVLQDSPAPFKTTTMPTRPRCPAAVIAMALVVSLSLRGCSGAGGGGHPGPHRGDEPVADDDGGVVEHLPRGGDDAGAHQGVEARGVGAQPGDGLGAGGLLGPEGTSAQGGQGHHGADESHAGHPGRRRGAQGRRQRRVGRGPKAEDAGTVARPAEGATPKNAPRVARGQPTRGAGGSWRPVSPPVLDMDVNSVNYNTRAFHASHPPP